MSEIPKININWLKENYFSHLDKRVSLCSGEVLVPENVINTRLYFLDKGQYNNVLTFTVYYQISNPDARNE